MRESPQNKGIFASPGSGQLTLIANLVARLLTKSPRAMPRGMAALWCSRYGDSQARTSVTRRNAEGASHR